METKTLRRPRKDITSILTKEMLQEAYLRLGSRKAVARELGITHPTVRYYMEQFNLDFKPKVKYDCDHNFFSRENEEVFYIAGFIAADGCVRMKSKNCFNLNIHLSDKDIGFLEEIKKIIKSNSRIKISKNNNKKLNSNWKNTSSCHLDIFSEKIYTDLQRFNIVPRKSLIYIFPDWMKTHPLCNHFIRGYVDGDGSYFYQKERVCFNVVGTESCIRSIKNILIEKCEVNSKIDIRKNEKIFSIEYGNQKDVESIVKYLYADAHTYLPRKYDIINKMI